VKKSVVVEFIGIPKAGKTEHIEKLTRNLARFGLSARFIQDQIRNAPIKDNETEKNRWAIRETGNLVAVAKSQDWDFILVDRGGWAYTASLTAHLKNGQHVKGKRQRKKARQTLRLALDLVNDEDFFVLIEIPPETALERDQQLGATKPGRIINPSFLSVLNEAYQSVWKKLPSHQRRKINGLDDFEKNQEKILKTLLSLANKNGNQKSGAKKERKSSMTKITKQKKATPKK